MKLYLMSSIKYNKGFSLLEFLVAGLLGLILLAGVVQLFIGSNRNYSMQGELATIQENGRFAMVFFEEQIQRGSWTEDETVPPAVELANSSDGQNDSVTISYRTFVDGVNNIDCTGNATPTALVSNTFFVDGTDLMCRGNGGGAAQALISNVEQFQVMYGVETDVSCPDGVVNNYVNYDSLSASDNILSVRLAILLRSQNNVLDAAESNNFQILDQNYASPSDRLLRRLFQQTVFMPNAVFATIGSPQAVIDCMKSKI